MNRKLPYSVPEGYFENLGNRVMESITSQPGTWHKLAPVFAIAASMLVLLGIGNFIIGKSSATDARASLTDDEIIEYLIDSRAPLAYFDESL